VTAAVLLALGCALTVAGAALLAWPAGVLVAGVLLLLAGIDLRR
jgi:hypothetical protein